MSAKKAHCELNSLKPILGKYVDVFSQPLTTSTKAYLKDTKHLLYLTLEVTVVDNWFLVTADGTSLYSINQHKKAVEAVKTVFEKEHQKCQNCLSWSLCCFDERTLFWWLF